MRARILNTFGYADSLDALVAHLHAETIPAAKEREGYRGMLVLGDRHTEHVIIVTLWDRAAEERASAHGAFLEKQLRDAAPTIGTRTTHEAFDVLLAEWPADQTPEGAPIDAAPSRHAGRHRSASDRSEEVRDGHDDQ